MYQYLIQELNLTYSAHVSKGSKDGTLLWKAKWFKMDSVD